MDPNSCKLYGGLSRGKFDVEKFDFGHGVILSKTYAHFMAPFLMAFEPAEPSRPHPSPWKSVQGGLGYDISAELFIPEELKLPKWFDRLNTIWWILALMRLKGTPLVFVPVVSNESFAKIRYLEREPYFWPMEIYPKHLIPLPQPYDFINESTLDWIKTYWVSGGVLMRGSADLNLAFRAFDHCIWTEKISLALVSLWGALERLFSPSPYELRFRVSAAIASYLEPSGSQRLELHKKVIKLYDVRSKAAHGHSIDEAGPFIETYALMKRILIKIIEENHIPTREKLEVMMFGDATNA